MIGLPGQASLKGVKILYMAYLFSVVVYFGVLWYIKHTPSMFPVAAHNPTLDMLKYAAPAVWVMVLILLFTVLNQTFFRPPYTSEPTVGKYQRYMLVHWAAFQVGPTLGVVLGIMGAGLNVFAVYAAIYVVLMLRFAPSEDGLADFQSRLNQG